MDNFNIEEVAVGDAVDFISPLNKVTSKVKEVNNQNRTVLINYFESPDLAIDRVNKWVSFDLLKIISKSH
jgi:hypothetical protein